MKIIVKAKAGAKQEKIEPVPPVEKDAGRMPVYKVWVKTAPEKGKANAAIANSLAKYFKLPKSQIVLRSGKTSSTKVFELISK